MKVLLGRHLDDRPFHEFDALAVEQTEVRHSIVFRVGPLPRLRLEGSHGWFFLSGGTRRADASTLAR